MNKLAWLVFIVLVACVLGLVVVDMARSGTVYRNDIKTQHSESKGLECVYNCDDFGVVLDNLK